MNNGYRLLPVALAPHIKDAIRASGHFVPESLWAAIIAAHDLVAPRKAALQELADIAQEFDMGYGPAAPERSETLADEKLEPAPENGLPNWSECNRIIENHEFRQRANAGKEGQVLDTPPPPEPTELHRFIYEYDDADSYKSAWFMHRLEKVIIEASRPAASSSAAPSVPDAWMKELSTETTSHVHKTWMENAGFGVWKEAAAQYTRPLYFAAPAASPAVLTDADIVKKAARYDFLRTNWECNYDRKDKEYAFFYNNRGELSGSAKSYNEIPDLESVIDRHITDQTGGEQGEQA